MSKDKEKDLLPTPQVGEVVQWLAQGRAPVGEDDLENAPCAAIVTERCEPGVVSLAVLPRGGVVTARIHVYFQNHPAIDQHAAEVSRNGLWRYIPSGVDPHEMHLNLITRQEQSRQENERRAETLRKMREEARAKIKTPTTVG